jgi:hypothetical protein
MRRDAGVAVKLDKYGFAMGSSHPVEADAADPLMALSMAELSRLREGRKSRKSAEGGVTPPSSQEGEVPAEPSSHQAALVPSQPEQAAESVVQARSGDRTDVISRAKEAAKGTKAKMQGFLSSLGSVLGAEDASLSSAFGGDDTPAAGAAAQDDIMQQLESAVAAAEESVPSPEEPVPSPEEPVPSPPEPVAGSSPRMDSAMQAEMERSASLQLQTATELKAAQAEKTELLQRISRMEAQHEMV